jgi:hypothetical protein
MSIAPSPSITRRDAPHRKSRPPPTRTALRDLLPTRRHASTSFVLAALRALHVDPHRPAGKGRQPSRNGLSKQGVLTPQPGFLERWRSPA